MTCRSADWSATCQQLPATLRWNRFPSARSARPPSIDPVDPTARRRAQRQRTAPPTARLLALGQYRRCCATRPPLSHTPAEQSASLEHWLSKRIDMVEALLARWRPE